jgi:hypothetical protein
MPALFKFMHGWQIGISKTGALFYWGPNGVLGASHALDMDNMCSVPAQPRYLHTRKAPLQNVAARAFDIPVKPRGMYWEVGYPISYSPKLYFLLMVREYFVILEGPLISFPIQQKGDILRFAVSVKEVIPFPIPTVKPPSTDNKGVHIINRGDKGEESSVLLMPHV